MRISLFHFILRFRSHFVTGEVPSKLEVLTSMASELAMSAVHNGRFHHATASSALEEKLTTRHSIIHSQPASKFPTSLKSRPVLRSASSSVFSRIASLDDASAFTDDLSRVGSAFSSEFNESQSSNNNQCVPGTAHTSQSDDSSEADEDTGSFAIDGPEDSAAGEWAAALVAVADQSMDIDNTFGRNRSVSESSSDESLSSALSKSPVGFWYVRPGSSLNESDEDDEPSCSSPSTQSSSQTNAADHSLSLPRILSPSGFSTSNLGKLLTESSPSILNAQEALHPTENELTDRVGPIAPSLDLPAATYTPLKTMSRSMSYSAFSTHNAIPPTTHLKSNLSRSILNNVRNISSSAHDHDLFRTYFVKFVDLLVVRETERVLHSKAVKA